MAPRRFVVAAAVDENGDAEVYSPVLSGSLDSIRYVKPGSGGYTNGVDFTITTEVSGVTLWAEENVNASTTRFPRFPTGQDDASDALYADEGQEVLGQAALTQDRVKIVIANAVSGTATFHITVND